MFPRGVEIACPECGAIYEQTQEKLPMSLRDSGSYNCKVCGHEFASWENTSRLPIFIFRRGPPNQKPKE